MQFNAFDLETHAKLQMADRMRWAAAHRRLEEAREGRELGMLARLTSALRSAFAPRQVPGGEAAAQPVGIAVVPEPEIARLAVADPYAGMVVIARGKEPRTLDAA